MTSKRSKKKTLLKITLTLLLGSVILVLVFPVWFPWLLKPVLGRYQVTFDSYDRQGYSGLTLRKVLFDQAGTRFTAEEISILQPTAWLWKHYVTGSTADHVTASEWSLVLTETEEPAPPSTEPPPTTATILNTTDRLIPTIREWLPAFTLNRGTVAFGNETISLDSVTWRDGKLEARLARQDQTLELEASLGELYRITTRLQPFGLAVSTDLKRVGSSWQTQTEILWQTNRAYLSSRFLPDDILPHDASLTGPPVIVPAKLLGLAGYEDPISSISAVWTNNLLEVTLAAAALAAGTNNLPPLSLKARATATTENIQITEFNITSPGITATLTAPIGLDPTTLSPSGTARLELRLTLDQLPFPDLRGTLEGNLLLSRGTNGPIPQAALRLQGNNLSFHNQQVSSLELKTELAWPALTVSELKVGLTNQTTVSLSADVDLEAQEIRTASWHANGSVPGLPAGYEGRGLKGNGTVSGPWMNPIHTGQLQVEQMILPGLPPLETRFEWTGRSLTLSNAALSTRAGQSTINLDASIYVALNPELNLTTTLKRLQFARAGQPVYQLRDNTVLSLTLGDNKEAPSATLEVDSLNLQGPGRKIEARTTLQWPESGFIQVDLTQFDPSVFQDFSIRPLADLALVLDQLTLNCGWTNSPLFGALAIKGTMQGVEDQTFSAQTRVELTPEHLVVKPSSISSESGAVLMFDGHLPVQIDPRAISNLYTVRPDDNLTFNISTHPNRPFWSRLAELTGAQLAAPRVDIKLSGTPTHPEGTIRAQADLIEVRALTNRTRLPKMEHLRVDIRLNEDRVALESLTLEVEQQLVRLNGTLPLDDEFWPSLFRKPKLPDWEQATARVQITNAAVAPFSSYLPKVFTPNGRLSADLEIRPGRQFHGTFDMTNAATRALPPLGAIRDIEAHVHFNGRTAEIEAFTGHLGGQPVTLSGTFAYRQFERPEFDLRLKGERIPFIRKAGLLIRSDIDLFARTRSKEATNNGPEVVISGELIPRDSLFLQDLKSLIPGGLAQSAQRPPYFSIVEEPFADWALDVRIKGNRFLRVRTPLFRGELSVNMKLQGPLKDPVSLGEIRIDDGRILFPFADLSIDQGSINLTTESPYDPELLINASARTFGYSLRLEAGGHASQPLLTFNSTPPLTSEEVLLMLTAGELPKREVVFSSRQKASRLATMLGKDLLARVSGREDKAERLIIRSGENISERGTLTHHLEYKLTDDWSIVGESDRFNALNAGVKWKLYSR